jgi:hypothetical protein
MSAYQKPTENLVDFNSSVFKTANEGTLTLSQAKGLFLGRTGTPNSVATTTTFNGGDIYVKGVRVGLGSGSFVSNVSVGTNALIANTAGTLNTAVGANTLASNVLCFFNTAIGYSALTSTGVGTHGFENTAVGAYCLTTNTIGDENSAVGSAAYYSNTTGINLSGIGYSAGFKNTTGSYNTNLGWGSGYTNTTGNYNTYVGVGVANPITTAFNNCTALGALTVIGASSSTAIGYGSTTTIANSIVLGTASETAYFPGTVATISLNTTNNVSINGAVFGVGSGGSNSLFSGATVGTGQGANNTLYGRNSYSVSISDGSSTNNTIVGSTAGSNNADWGIMNDHTIIGYNSGGVGATSLLQQINITCLGSGANVINGSSNSTAIGYGSQATLANQIMLGRTQETVYCSGIPTTGATTYTSLVLSSGLQLQTVYTSQPTANQLGYRIALSNVAISALTTTTPASFGALSLTVGTWSINFTFELLNSSVSSPVTAQTYYFSTASGGSYASTRISNTGTFRKQSTETWAIGDNPAVSASSVYVATSSISIYPTIQLAFTGGTITGAGWASATRIA